MGASVDDGETMSVVLDINEIPGYELVAPIGGGAFGQVYLARRAGPHGFEKLLVLKRLHPHAATNRRHVEMFLDEARLAARIHDPRVVEVHELGEIDGVPFMAMEYLAGESVFAILVTSNHHPERQMPFPLVARVVAEAAGGLHAAHELRDTGGQSLNVVHRDVTPSNVFVLYSGGVKLLDFGVAKARSNLALTEGNELKGKLGYHAPEQIRNQHVDRRADLFSLGVVLWEMLTVRRLFGASDVSAAMQMTVESDAPPPSKHNPAIPPALDAIVARALAREPSERFQTAEELQFALESFLTELGQPASTLHVGQYMKTVFAERLVLHTRLLEVSESAACDRPAELASVVRQLQTTANSDGFGNLAEQMSIVKRFPPAVRASLLAAALVVVVTAVMFKLITKAPEPEPAPAVAVTTPIDAASVSPHDAFVRAPELASAVERVESAIRTGRISGPPGDNALELLLDRERAAPDDPRIPELRALAISELLSSAELLWINDRKASARTLYKDVLLFDAKHPLATERLRISRPLKAKAPPRVDDERVTWLVTQIELAIIERRFVAPKDRNALDLLIELRSVDPTNQTALRLGTEVALALDVAAGAASGSVAEDLHSAAEKLRKPAIGSRPSQREPKGKSSGDVAARRAAEEGQQLLSAGRLADARRAFERSIVAHSRWHPALGGLAEVAYNEANFTLAVLAAKRAIALSPRTVPYRMTLAKAYYKMLRYSDAAAEWKRVLQIEPRNAVAKKNAEMVARKVSLQP